MRQPRLLGAGACLALCLCALPVHSYLAFPEVMRNPEGNMDCHHTCATAEVYEGPHVAVAGDGEADRTLCYVRPGEHGDEGLFGTKGGGESCHVVKPSDPDTRYTEVSAYLCVCQDVDSEGAVDTLWAPLNSVINGMYAVNQDASNPCRAPLDDGSTAMGTLQVSAENVAVCSAAYFNGTGWLSTYTDLVAPQDAVVDVLYAHV